MKTTAGAPRRPVLLVIMDGVGVNPSKQFNGFAEANTPHLDKILKNCPDLLASGGSCICGPDGEWLVEPMVEKEKLLVASLDQQRVREERQNFDPAGHYARPDVNQLTLNRQRQSTLKVIE